MTSRAAGVRYARALFDVALKESDVAQVGGDLADFAGIVAGNDALSRVLSNPAIPAGAEAGRRRPAARDRRQRASVVANLLALLADRDRLALLPEIAAAYRERLMQHEQVIRVEARDRHRAAGRSRRRPAAAARARDRTPAEDVHLETRVDSSIIGGAITKIGSTVYDGSVTRQLEKMKDSVAPTSRRSGRPARPGVTAEDERPGPSADRRPRTRKNDGHQSRRNFQDHPRPDRQLRR